MRKLTKAEASAIKKAIGQLEAAEKALGIFNLEELDQNASDLGISVHDVSQVRHALAEHLAQLA